MNPFSTHFEQITRILKELGKVNSFATHNDHLCYLGYFVNGVEPIYFIVIERREPGERARLCVCISFVLIIRYYISYTRIKCYSTTVSLAMRDIIVFIVRILSTMRRIVESCKISSRIIPRDTERERDEQTPARIRCFRGGKRDGRIIWTMM